MSTLAEFEQEMQGFDPATAALDEVTSLVARLHGCRRVLSAHEDRLATAAKRHAATGDAPPAIEILSGDGDVSRGAARNTLRRRDAATELEALGTTIHDGDARTENVDAIARALERFTDPAQRARFVSFDTRLAGLAARLAPDRFGRELDQMVRRAMTDHGLSLEERQRRDAEMSIWRDRHGMTRLRGVLDPEWGAILETALDTEMRSLAQARKNAAVRTADADPGVIRFDDHLRAEALIEQIRRSHHPTTGPALPLVAVIVDHHTLHQTAPHHPAPHHPAPHHPAPHHPAPHHPAPGDPAPHDPTTHDPAPGDPAPREIGPGPEFFDGRALSPTTLTRLCCDAVIQHVIRDRQGLPLAVGRRHRTATDAQRIALRTLYPRCAWPECDRRFDHCQIHHVTPWEHGGQTDLNNLLPLCNQHHHLVHDQRWQLDIDPHRTITITRPNGTTHDIVGLRPTRNDADGAVIHPTKTVRRRPAIDAGTGFGGSGGGVESDRAGPRCVEGAAHWWAGGRSGRQLDGSGDESIGELAEATLFREPSNN